MRHLSQKPIDRAIVACVVMLAVQALRFFYPFDLLRIVLGLLSIAAFYIAAVSLWEWRDEFLQKRNTDSLPRVLLLVSLVLSALLCNLVWKAASLYMTNDMMNEHQLLYSHLQWRFRTHESQPFGQRGSQFGYYGYNSRRLVTSQFLPETFVKSGAFVDYFEDGRKSEEGRSDVNGLQGTYIRWHDNGRLYLETTFIDSEIDGTLTVWRPDGRKWSEGTVATKSISTNWTYYTEEYPDGIEAPFDLERVFLLNEQPEYVQTRIKEVFGGFEA